MGECLPGRRVNLVDPGPLAQLARALASHARGHWFKSSTVHGETAGRAVSDSAQSIPPPSMRPVVRPQRQGRQRQSSAWRSSWLTSAEPSAAICDRSSLAKHG